MSFDIFLSLFELYNFNEWVENYLISLEKKKKIAPFWEIAWCYEERKCTVFIFILYNLNRLPHCF